MSFCRRAFVVLSGVFFLFTTGGWAQSWMPAGLLGKPVTVVAIDPHNPTDIYAGTFYEGIYKSTDGGLTWTELSKVDHPFFYPHQSFTYIEFDSLTPGVVYVLSYSGLFKSFDHGLNWTRIKALSGMYNCLAIDPQSPWILYTGGWAALNGGVFKSVDAGTSWDLMGLLGIDTRRLAINPVNPLVIYAATEQGVFKSLDGGATWLGVNTGLTSNSCNSLFLDPNAPETLYVGTQGGGIFKTTDGGASWSASNAGITDLKINAAGMDPNASQNLCAGTPSKIFLSRNSGASWSEKSDGLPPSQISSVALITSSPLSVYAGNRGMGYPAPPDAGVYVYTEKPVLAATPETLRFGWISPGQKTPDQSISIHREGDEPFSWTITSGAGWLSCVPSLGNGPGKVSVTIDASGLPPGTYSSVLSVNSAEAYNSPFSIPVTLTVYEAGTDGLPFGFFDTPLDDATVSGSVAVTGWALDDVGVQRVEIKRESDPDDPVGLADPDGLVFIGEAVFVKGARSDIESLYPTFPQNNQAGWGYMMLTYSLPRKGNGTFRLHAVVEDVGGRRMTLGIRRITVNNADSVLPFGTIDTPGQGETISGDSYMHFGWALTPPPNMIPVDASTLWVEVDGILLGHPVYNQYRVDIAALFPECLNGLGAVGFYVLDTTSYENGLHTISWGVSDNAGNSDGIGSRFFEVLNLGQSAAETGSPEALKYFNDQSDRLKIEVAGPTEMEIEELEAVKITLKGEGGSRFVGWGADKSKGLPAGSTLDHERGIFYWRPGPGFLGRQVLNFAVTDGVRMSRSVVVEVTIGPKIYGKGRKKVRDGNGF